MGGGAFLAGYFGPLYFTPDKNLGPLLGIFITGPIGTLAGTVIGIAIAYFAGANENSNATT